LEGKPHLTRLVKETYPANSPDDLTLTAANGPEMPYLGCFEITFQFAFEVEELDVPGKPPKGGTRGAS